MSRNQVRSRSTELTCRQRAALFFLFTRKLFLIGTGLFSDSPARRDPHLGFLTPMQSAIQARLQTAIS